MSNLNKELNELSDKLGKFKIKNLEKNTPKSVKKLTAKASLFYRRNRGKTLRKTAKSKRQLKFEEKRRKSAITATERRKKSKAAHTAKIRATSGITSNWIK
jgi:hypothetical protein